MTDLLPFRKAIDSYWTSNDVRNVNSTAPTNKCSCPRPNPFSNSHICTGYTYPVVAGVDVSKPSTPAEREVHRRNLQKDFGVRASPLPGPRAGDSPILCQKPQGVPDGQVHIPNYRHVVIAVALVEHAFNQSYALEVEYKTAHGVVEYGHVAVFTRGRDTRCAGCAGRRAAGGVVHGVIHIPAEHLADVLARNKDPVDTVRDEIEFLKQSLHARIRIANGVEYIVGQSTAGQVLDDAFAPKMSLHVAYGCHSDQGTRAEMPFDLFGWEAYGELFAGKWGMV